MNKSDLINAISTHTEMSKSATEKFLNALQEVMVDALQKDQKITLTGFLSVEKTMRKATTGRNPRTGEEIQIPAKNVVKMKAGKVLSDSVN